MCPLTSLIQFFFSYFSFIIMSAQPKHKKKHLKNEPNNDCVSLIQNKREHSESAAVHHRPPLPAPSHTPLLHPPLPPSFVPLPFLSSPSRGQAVQGVQGEEDVRFALEGARPVPQQLAALQVGGDVLHADGLQGWRRLTAGTCALQLTPAGVSSESSLSF